MNYESYRLFIAQKIADHKAEIAESWLQALSDVVNEELRDIFPTRHYLDHIPALIAELGVVLRDNDGKAALANSLISQKARQFGALRHSQQATVTQLLREYDVLSKVLENFVLEQSLHFDDKLSESSGIKLMAAISRIVRAIMQSTVNTFVEHYMDTIRSQTEKIVSFNSFVSHELKTPLQAALLNAELLAETCDQDDDIVDDLRMIHGSIQQAATMLRNIESMTRLGGKKSLEDDDPTTQVIDLSAFTRDIASQLAAEAAERGVDLDIDEDMGERELDAGRLKLVLTNLLSNSIKYSDPAKPSRHVKVTAEKSADGSPEAMIVSDNGLGIAPNMVSRVFDLRVRAHAELDTAHAVSGHGMGLYLVRTAMKELGGDIALDSVEGEGTRIQVRLG